LQNIIDIAGRKVGKNYPMYSIAEIGSNFDGSLDRAKHLVDLAVDFCKADAVKFQSFKAEKIVSDVGFQGRKDGFQSKWDKPVYEVYKDAEFPREWHEILFEYCNKKGVPFLSAPYDFEAVDLLDDLGVAAFKIGSGDVTWLELLEYVGSKNKPVILSTGASSLSEVDEAVSAIKNTGNNKIILLQCVTNYPSSFESANVNAMRSMGDIFNLEVGYSDHTPGSIVALASRALGGCIIEKHFTDDKNRPGPDHPFAMDHHDFKKMVEDVRTLEKTFGSPYKKLYEEEKLTVDLQRRCIRAKADIKPGTVISRELVEVLRPSPPGSLPPKTIREMAGMTTTTSIKKGEYFTWKHF